MHREVWVLPQGGCHDGYGQMIRNRLGRTGMQKRPPRYLSPMHHMRPLLLLALLAPLATMAQCTKCKSFTEAAKAPDGVVSIQINPHVTGEILTEVPTDLAQYTHLRELYLTDHGLSEVPASIGSLTALQSLSLAGNSLKALPEELFQLKQLKELILNDNDFSVAYKKELAKRVKKEMPGAMLLLE